MDHFQLLRELLGFRKFLELDVSFYVRIAKTKQYLVNNRYLLLLIWLKETSSDLSSNLNSRKII